MTQYRHTMPFGATLDAGLAQFRLWAPAAGKVELLIHEASGQRALPAISQARGWFSTECSDVAAGCRYQWRIDGAMVVPDPASRSNPQGPHGPSVLIDPLAFEWNPQDDAWTGRPWHEAVFYQVHIGSFTRAGSYAAAAAELPRLADMGITAIQLMPLADFPGRFGWGYDGVLPFAPYHGYGTPDDLKALVQAAHRLGLMVFGDVVYNHFGPDGNYLSTYAPHFFSSRHRTAWGAAINYDGDDADIVRDFVVHNALYWLQEYRFDGLRLDAVHAMRDDSRPDILQELSQRVRAACTGRQVHLVLENDSNDARRLGPPGMPGLYEGQWNGDVHHCLHVLLTGEQDGYYAEYDQPLAQLGQALAHGFAREGGPHNVEGAPPRRAAQGQAPLLGMLNFLQNHDQIGNRAFGERLSALTDPAALELASAIVLLAPSIPLLFMGEPEGSDAPFLYFADWSGSLREAVREGRRREFAHFERYAQPARDNRLPDPCSSETFARCHLPVTSPAAQRGSLQAELLRLRAQELWPALPRLLDGGHDARQSRTVLQVAWRFGAWDGQASARRLIMQANLSERTWPAAGLYQPAEDAPPFMALGLVGAATPGSEQSFGPWAGRWFWMQGIS